MWHGSTRDCQPSPVSWKLCRPGLAFSPVSFKMPQRPQGLYREHISVIQPVSVQCSAQPCGKQAVLITSPPPLNCSLLLSPENNAGDALKDTKG